MKTMKTDYSNLTMMKEFLDGKTTEEILRLKEYRTIRDLEDTSVGRSGKDTQHQKNIDSLINSYL